MYKDPTEWREGFKRWKETGESPWKAGKRLSKFATGTEGWDDTEEQKAVQEWGSDWKTRTTAAGGSKVILKWNITGKRPKPESSEEYTKRRVAEETKRTWLSDAADIAHGVGETALAMHPYTSIPYFGAKVGQDVLYGNVGINTVLNAATPFIGTWGANYINPNSLLNKNIRTSLYNNKIPYGYNVFDPNIYKSYIEGSVAALGGREIKQLAKPKWMDNVKNYVIQVKNPEGGSVPTLTEMQANHRAAAWARYLGLDDRLLGVGYVPSRKGFVTKRSDPFFKDEYARLVKESEAANGGKLRGVISDKSVYNTAGGMGYEVNSGSNVARIFDKWDLQPFKRLGIPYLKNFEASSILPGAKPFDFETFVSLDRGGTPVLYF